MSNRRQFLTRLIAGALGATGVGGVLLSKKNQPSTAQTAQPYPQKTAPLRPPEPIHIATLSDLNGPYGTTAYRREVHRAIAVIVQEKPDLVLCGGDMIAGQKRGLTRQQLDAMWASFDQAIAAPLRDANIPFLFTLGNHDASNSRDRQGNFTFDGDRQAAAAYWRSHPANHASPRLTWLSTSDYPFFWTAKFDDVFLLSWDASGFRLQQSHQQLAWNALRSPEAQQASHRIVLGHLPLFAVAKGRNTAGAILANPQTLLTELQNHGVDLYISGHQHAYFLGRSQSLDLLHLGNAGDGSRSLLQGDRPAGQTLTWLEIPGATPQSSTANIGYTTLDLNTGRVIPPDALPLAITGFDQRTIARRML